MAETGDENISQNNLNSKEEEPPQELNGWLMKRNKFSHKWTKKWASVRRGEIVYGRSEGVVDKRIPLPGAEIAALDKKAYSFKIRPKDSKRVHLFCAESEEEQRDWMQAICFAKVVGTRTDHSEACSIQ